MNRVVDVLGRLSERGLFDSRLYEWTTEIRNPQKIDSTFYTKTKAVKGQKTAEVKLEEVIAKRYLRDFSGCFATISTGLIALATADPEEERIKEIDIDLYPDLGMGWRKREEDDRAILAWNPKQPGCGCNSAAGSHIWGLYDGNLGLTAMVVSFNERKGNLCLDLVFSLRGKSRETDGFVDVCIERDGHTHGQQIVLTPRMGSLLAYALGIMNVKDIVCMSMSGGGYLDDWMGFPGAEEYLAKHIGVFGAYLSEIAQKIGEHKH